MNTLKKS